MGRHSRNLTLVLSIVAVKFYNQSLPDGAGTVSSPDSFQSILQPNLHISGSVTILHFFQITFSSYALYTNPQNVA